MSSRLLAAALASLLLVLLFLGIGEVAWAGRADAIPPPPPERSPALPQRALARFGATGYLPAKWIRGLAYSPDGKYLAERRPALTFLKDRLRPALKEVLTGTAGLDARQRASRLLDGLDNPAASAEALRVLRVIEWLEYDGGSEAVAILKVLAKEGVRETERADATKALARLAKIAKPKKD